MFKNLGKQKQKLYNGNFKCFAKIKLSRIFKIKEFQFHFIKEIKSIPKKSKAFINLFLLTCFIIKSVSSSTSHKKLRLYGNLRKFYLAH